jgi:hypothetical protein
MLTLPATHSFPTARINSANSSSSRRIAWPSIVLVDCSIFRSIPCLSFQRLFPQATPATTAPSRLAATASTFPGMMLRASATEDAATPMPTANCVVSFDGSHLRSRWRCSSFWPSGESRRLAIPPAGPWSGPPDPGWARAAASARVTACPECPAPGRRRRARAGRDTRAALIQCRPTHASSLDTDIGANRFKTDIPLHARHRIGKADCPLACATRGPG